MNFTSKITTAIATVAIIAGSVVPAAFANTTVTINHNNIFSHSKVNVKYNNKIKFMQSNASAIVTTVNSTANTGRNKLWFNTGGNNVISTGNATSNVTVNVGGSSNTATVPSCGCTNTTTNVSVDHNNAFTSNKVNVSNNNWFSAFQQNLNFILTGVNSSTNTGGNSSSFNTGGSNGIGTGDATSNVTVNVNGSSNTMQ